MPVGLLARFLPALGRTITLLLGFATAAFFVAGGAFLAHEIVSRRDALARRVEAIRARPAEERGAPRLVRREPRRSWLSRGGTGFREAKFLGRYMPRLGISAQHAPAMFFAFRITLAAALGAGVAFMLWDPQAVGLGRRPLATGALFALAGWAVPGFWVRWLAARRIRAIEAGLPEALELLVVAVEAGLALEDGMERIVGELRRSQPALAEELAITCADLKILPSRDAALANLAKRVDTPSVRSVVTTLSQTMRYGTPLAQALRVVSAELRNEALIRLEERANRLPVLLTVPMMVLILPSIFLIVGGPAVIRLIDVLRH